MYRFVYLESPFWRLFLYMKSCLPIKKNLANQMVDSLAKWEAKLPFCFAGDFLPTWVLLIYLYLLLPLIRHCSVLFREGFLRLLCPHLFHDTEVIVFIN